jgi:hypothetical protein
MKDERYDSYYAEFVRLRDKVGYLEDKIFELGKVLNAMLEHMNQEVLWKKIETGIPYEDYKEAILIDRKQ